MAGGGVWSILLGFGVEAERSWSADAVAVADVVEDIRQQLLYLPLPYLSSRVDQGFSTLFRTGPMQDEAIHTDSR